MFKQFINILFILLFALVMLRGQAQNSKINRRLHYKIDTYLENNVKSGYAASVLVAKDGNIILSKGYGWADREKKIPNTAATVFNIGSVTKQFTAAAILKLAEKGKLKTSDQLGQLFEQAPIDKKRITIHQLLTHTTGVSPRIGGFRYEMAGKQRFLKEFFEANLQSTPGTKHQYANANYIMLAAIIELVSGTDYTTFLRKHFWEPLGMDHTGYKSISFNNEQIAHGYYYNYSDGVWKDWGITQEHLPHTGDHWYSIGKGDMYSTTKDLFKWHLALKTNKVLTEKSRKLFEMPFVPEDKEGKSHYAYGWATFKNKSGHKVVWHNGSNGIYFSNFIRFVEEDVLVIVLSNTILNSDSENVGWQICNMIFDENHIPQPVTKLSYELVYDYIRANEPKNAVGMPGFLEQHLGTPLQDKAVFNRIGFKLLEKEEKPGWGLELLNLNVGIFSDDGNLWDSLGEAYFKYGQTKNAIESYTKAIALKPNDNCHWCKNSQNKLRQLKSQ